MKIKMSTESSRLFDVLRGVAALFVVLGHSRQQAANIFDLHPSGASLIEKTLLVPSSFAMESVAVFFVLSGFLVGGQTITQVSSHRFLWLEFLAKRLSRLWVVLLPGIIFTWAMWWLNNQWLASHSETPTIQEAICNMVFLQESWCNSFSNNSSLWSLSYEFWFYIVFAGIAMSIVNIFHKHYWAALIGFSIVLCVLYVFGIKLLFLIPGWLIGVLVAWGSSKLYILNNIIRRKSYLYLFLSVLLITSCSMITNVLEFNRSELTAFISLPAALFIFIAIRAEGEPRLMKVFIDIGAAFGQRSFSIYVFHLPIVILFINLLDSLNWANDLSLPTLTYLTFSISVPFTLILWFLTERHTPAVRSLLLSFVSNSRIYTQALASKFRG